MAALHKRWQKALTSSFCIHLLLLIACGFMADRLFALPAQQETVIELEIGSDDSPAAADGLPDEAAAEPETVDETIAPDEAVNPVPATEQAVPAAKAPVKKGHTAVATSAGTGQTTGQPAAGTAASPGTGSTGQGGTNSRREIIPPLILSDPSPVYPPAEKKAGVQGTTTLRIEVQENGLPGSISVAKSSGSAALDEAAVAAVQQWRFVPAKNRQTGNAISCFINRPIAFRLQS
ncbi:energy transducer TonB [Propionispora hippei]|uniref:Protein TonB n=1 Tax=Propionispora hippei DSM 15287 TaxID=1123003 RepID=A0A1M6KAU7_9FIRM|nr:energy transducer TonB [Propionispora hippei]SHJ56033.1 protein TonB [Propionispora hippei DSM 15287]